MRYFGDTVVLVVERGDHDDVYCDVVAAGQIGENLVLQFRDGGISKITDWDRYYGGPVPRPNR